MRGRRAWSTSTVQRRRAYYYARVTQEREHRVFQPHYGVAYASPVWLDVR